MEVLLKISGLVKGGVGLEPGPLVLTSHPGLPWKSETGLGPADFQTYL